MNIALYLRQSKFSNQSESIENQESICTEYCNKYFPNAKIYVYKDEGYSGKNTDRPQFQKMLEDISTNNIKFIITYKLDRLCRSTKDFVSLVDKFEQQNVYFTSVKENFDLSSTPGKMIALMYSMFSQLERESISERIRDNMYEYAKSGRWLGGPAPFGYKLIKVEEDNKIKSYLQIDNSSIDIIEYIYETFLHYKSITQVRNIAYRNRISGPRGTHLDLSTISNILHSSIYVRSTPEVIDFLKNSGMNVFGKANYKSGFLTYGKKNIMNHKPIATISKHDGIIDGDTWLKVQSLLKENKRKSPRQATGKTALLSGILKCKICGSNMRISYRENKKGNKQLSYYVCGKKKKLGKAACICKNIPTHNADNLVLNSIGNIDKSKIIDIYNDTNLFKYDINSNESEINILTKNIDSKNKRMTSLSNKLSLTDNEIVLKNIINNMENLATEISSLNKQLEILKNKMHSVKQEDIDLINYSINNFREYLNNESIESKRNLVSRIIDTAVWDPNTYTIEIFFKNSIID